MKDHIRLARSTLVSQVKTEHLESCSSVYPIMAKLRMLNDLEKVASILVLVSSEEEVRFRITLTLIHFERREIQN